MHNFLNVTTPYIYTQRDLVSSCHQKKASRGDAWRWSGQTQHHDLFVLFAGTSARAWGKLKVTDVIIEIKGYQSTETFNLGPKFNRLAHCRPL